MIEFLRIEDRGLGLVAVFDRGYAGFMFTDAGYRYHSDRTFCLNEENLRLRITNLERDGLDASVERVALAELTQRTTTQPEPPGRE